MKVKSIVALVGLVLVLIMACSEHTIEPATEYADGRVVGTIHGIVVDFQENTRFDTSEVQVSWVSGGQVHTKNLDTLGYYIITDLVPGYYDLTFHGSDEYAVTKIDSVKVPTLEEVNDGSYATEKDYEHVVARNVGLYKFNSSVKGRVFAKQNTQNTVPAEGATIVADYSKIALIDDPYAGNYHISPDRYTVEADADGIFEFSALPSADAVNLYVEEYAEGSNEYQWDGDAVALIYGDTVDVGEIELEITGDKPVILSNNFMDETAFPVTGNLIMTFNKPMDATTFEVELGGLDIEVRWLNGVTLTVDPVLPLEYGEEYTLKLKGYSSSDNTVFNNEDNAGDFVEMSFRTYAKLNPLVVSSNFYDIENQTHVGNFELDTDLTVTFSKAINTTNFTATLYLDADGDQRFDDPTTTDDEEIECELAWNTEGTVLTIDPIVDFLLETKYCVQFAGWSTDSMAIEMPDFDNNTNTDDLFFVTIPAIKFVSTSIENEQGKYENVPISETDSFGPNIEVVFSRSIDLDNSKTDIYLETCDDFGVFRKVRCNTIQTVSPNDIGFILTPSNELEPNEDYYLYYDVYSDIPGDHASVADHPDSDDWGNGTCLKFTTEMNATVPSRPSGFRLAVDDDEIDFNGWTGDATEGDVSLRWNTQNNVDEYNIYARDNGYNTDMILVATVNAVTHLEVQDNVHIQLPEEFDLYANDGIQTPFCDTLEVTFGLTAVNDAGESNMRFINTDVGDMHAPDDLLLDDDGANFNRTGQDSDRWYTFIVTSTRGEYLDDSHGDIIFTDNDDTQDSDWDEDDDFRNFELQADRKTITFDIRAAATLNRVGDRFEMDFYDLAGNAGRVSIILP